MSKVKLIGVTKPVIEGLDNTEDLVAYCARVSNPSNQFNTLTAPKLLKYLSKHKHWSPFEMVHVVMEVETTRDIARQILRHRSFSFQEFSQRYADPLQSFDDAFEFSVARLQDEKNRQNSIVLDDSEQGLWLKNAWLHSQQRMIFAAKREYEEAIKQGVAKEVARKVLPEGLTISRMYMSGSLRSWIHYCEVRGNVDTQLEHREIAHLCREILVDQFPSLKDIFTDEVHN
jgi:thymidylate synthase (FAD)